MLCPLIVLFTSHQFILTNFQMHLLMVVMYGITVGTELILANKLIFFKVKLYIVTLPTIFVVHEFLKPQLLLFLLLNKLSHLVLGLDLLHRSQSRGQRVLCVNLSVFLLVVEVGQLVNVTATTQSFPFLFRRTQVLVSGYP